jgi:hypothetical protein
MKPKKRVAVSGVSLNGSGQTAQSKTACTFREQVFRRRDQGREIRIALITLCLTTANIATEAKVI